MKNIGKYISQEELNRISGVGAFAFNTIYKLVWLRENHAGDTVKFLLGDIFADVFHDLRRAGAFPGYDRIEQVAGVIHQRAVHAEGGNRDGRHLFRI